MRAATLDESLWVVKTTRQDTGPVFSLASDEDFHLRPGHGEGIARCPLLRSGLDAKAPKVLKVLNF
jgi:hypothetical protein